MPGGISLKRVDLVGTMSEIGLKAWKKVSRAKFVRFQLVIAALVCTM